MKLKNRQVTFANAVLKNIKLEVTQSAGRRRFLRDLRPFHDDIVEAQTEIQQQYADKDKNGEVKADPVTGLIKFSGENKKKSEAEWRKLEEGEIFFEVSEKNERDVNTVIDILTAHRDEYLEKNEKELNAEQYEYFEELENLIETLKNK